MNDIPFSVFVQGFRKQRSYIAVKLFHLIEIGVTDSNDDDRKWLVRSSDDLFNCVLHVVDDSIGKNQANVIHLIELTDFTRLRKHEIIDVF